MKNEPVIENKNKFILEIFSLLGTFPLQRKNVDMWVEQKSLSRLKRNKGNNEQ